MNTVCFAVANEKGGTGKTSTAVSVAAALSERKHSVLLIDLDPAGAAGAWLGVRSDGAALLKALDGLSRLDPAIAKVTDTLSLAAGGRALVGSKHELGLKHALEGLRLRVDFIVIDTPPGLSSLGAAGLAAAKGVIVPVETTALGLEGPAAFARTAQIVRERLNPELAAERFVIVKLDGRTRLSTDVAEHIRSTYGQAVFKSSIRVCTKLAEAPSHAQPVTTYAPSSRSAEDYRQLATEVERVKDWR